MTEQNEANESQVSQETKEPTTFDIPSYAEKARQALERLRTEQRPGEQVGQGGKMDVLSAVRPEIEKLYSEGYTTKQIAEILRQDVFKVLPKSITQLLGSKKSKPRKPRKKRLKTDKPIDTAPRAAPPSAASPEAEGPQQQKTPTIVVKPDKFFTE